MRKLGTATAALALLVGAAVSGLGGTAAATVDNAQTAAQSSTRPSDIQPMVMWPFSTCDRHTYYYFWTPSYYWVYLYDHTDLGRINYYRVNDTQGQKVGNGWASCVV